MFIQGIQQLEYAQFAPKSYKVWVKQKWGGS